MNQRRIYGAVVESVNVSVRLYVPVRRASVAAIAWRNVIATAALETGCVQLAGFISTRSDCGRENVPFVRRPGSLTVSAALPAVEITLAVVDAVYSRVTPGWKAPKDAFAPSKSESVAGTVPPTGVETTSALAGVLGAHARVVTTYALPATQRHRLGLISLGGLRSKVGCS